MVRTDYEAHELHYRRKRQNGHEGWDLPDEVAVQRAHLAEVFDGHDLPRTGRAIDVGCGAGDYSIWLAQRGFRVVGVDISPTAIEWARDKAAAAGVEVEFRVGSVLTLEGIEDGAFDLALDWHCLHCIIGEDRRRFLRSVHRVLRPGGLLVSETMCGEAIPEPERGEWDPETGLLVEGDVAFRYIGPASDIEDEIRATGFRIRHSEVRHDTTGLVGDDLRTVSVKEG